MFSFLKKKKKAKKDIFEQGEFNLKNIDVLSSHRFMVSLLYANDFVNTIYPACASCYGISEDKNKEYNKRVSYIGRRVIAGHTSILEHSNVVVQAYIALNEEAKISAAYDHNPFIKSELTDYEDSTQDIISLVSEVRDVCRYLTIDTDYINDSDGNPIMKMTIGGSIRGFRYIYENIKNRHNRLFISIFQVLKTIIPMEFFIDFINDEVMNPYNTIEITKELQENIQIFSNTGRNNNDLIDIINMDNVKHISKLLCLDIERCFDFVSITVDFKKMSRIITQQLTRHRNGITQESQRYVDYSNAQFNSPANFKDKYDSNEKYDTPFGKFTLQELGEFISGTYQYLVAQGVDKEDARGYLPMNIQCSKLFMTFTLRSLFMFIHLRTDKHAQAEIRQYAELLANMTDSYAIDLGMDSMKNAAEFYSQPLYKKEQLKDNLYDEIDEEV